MKDEMKNAMLIDDEKLDSVNGGMEVPEGGLHSRVYDVEVLNHSTIRITPHFDLSSVRMQCFAKGIDRTYSARRAEETVCGWFDNMRGSLIVCTLTLAENGETYTGAFTL